MAFCSNCGNQLDEGSQFCKACGAQAAAAAQPPAQQPPQPQAQPTQAPVMQAPIPQPAPRKYGVVVWLIPLLLLLFFSCCCCSSFGLLTLVGAQGQPATVVPPSPASESKTGTSGTSVPIPNGLTADSGASDISLKWNAVTGQNLKNYQVYRSIEPGQNFALAAKVDSGEPHYTDSAVKEGVTYYYVVTAVTVDGAESGNSLQTSAIVDSAPLVPKGTYSWADVKARCEADSKYLKLLTKVTGLTMSDVERLAKREKEGMNLKTTLTQGTIITNSTKDYKILPNYKLKTNRQALTDENGTPHVLTKCGNPMKIQIPVTVTTVVIQKVQIFITNVIMVFPPSIINIIINAAQPINDIVITILPNGIKIWIGMTVAPPPPEIYIDPVDFGEDFPYTDEELEVVPEDHEEQEEPTHEEETEQPPSEEEELPEGQKWIEEGKLLVIANPPDPGPGQSVTMVVRLTPAKQGVDISYEVHGTDGYSSSGTKQSDANGEISFNIPGGATGVQDTINVNVPSEGLQGSAQYQF